jgi:hypothetical protein
MTGIYIERYQIMTANLSVSQESHRQQYVAVLSYLWQSLSNRYPIIQVMQVQEY